MQCPRDLAYQCITRPCMIAPESPSWRSVRDISVAQTCAPGLPATPPAHCHWTPIPGKHTRAPVYSPPPCLASTGSLLFHWTPGLAGLRRRRRWPSGPGGSQPWMQPSPGPHLRQTAPWRCSPTSRCRRSCCCRRQPPPGQRPPRTSCAWPPGAMCVWVVFGLNAEKS